MSNKSMGQIFTPHKIVCEILDTIGYKDNILNKTIFEPSFGDGAFLKEIVSRLISCAQNNNLTADEIKTQLENNIYGVELDTSYYHETIQSLNNICMAYGISNIRWNLINGNTLTTNFDINFDYISGNPPYVRNHMHDENTKDILSRFKFTNGSTDLYIAFFEYCINLMHEDTKLGFITPNSYFKNTSQKKFREYLKNCGLLEGITDYGDVKVFDNADTYTAITYLSKNNSSFIYKKKRKTSSLGYGVLGDIWSFDNVKFMEDIKNKSNYISDFVTVQNGIATNADKVYIGKASKIDDDTSLFNGYLIESNILVDCVKGSRFNGVITEKALFPYELVGDKYVPIEEIKLKTKYPLAYEYLSAHKDILLNRNMDSNSVWYQFGRSQSIQTFGQEKYVINYVFSCDKERVSVHKIGKNTLVYSGIYFTGDKLNCEKIKKKIESKTFFKYAKTIGKNMANNYKYITVPMIKNYKF